MNPLRFTSLVLKNELMGRYAGSLLGPLWGLVLPLLLGISYFFVFSVLLGMKAPGLSTPSDFGLFLLSGMIPWFAVHFSISRAPRVILDYAPLLREIPLPLHLFPVAVAIAGLVPEIAVLLFFIPLLAAKGTLSFSVLLLIPLLLPRVLFVAGMASIASIANVILRDVDHAISLLLMAWFFATPILYPASYVPKPFSSIISLNPLSPMVEAYRGALLGSPLPSPGLIAWSVTISIFFFVFGFFLMERLRGRILDSL